MSFSRRDVMSGLAGAALASAAARGGADAPPSGTSASGQGKNAGAREGAGITRQYVHFISTLRFETLPESVVHATKRFVLDSLGCAVAGWKSEKGRLAATLMQSAGGRADAHILGTNVRVGAANAAFANAELMNALDYDAIPHTPPVTLPAVWAIAEMMRASGKAVIVATLAAHELAARLSSASSQMSASILATGRTPEIFGINNEAIIASAGVAASLAGGTPEAIASAMGLGAYYCPPQVAHDWELVSPKTHVKYTPVGVICQGAVNAALLSRSGYTGNPAVLDGELAFPAFYRYEKWTPEAATAGLGSIWRIETVDFKPYACCRYIHSQLDCLSALVREHGLKPHEIEHIRSSGPPFNANPDPLNVRTQEDAQFSTPYMLALVANGIALDANCQSRELLGNPDVRAMMKRITWDTMPRNPDPALAHAARVEVVARGRTYVKTVSWPRGTAARGAALSDAELTEKFVANVGTMLTAEAARRLARRLWALEGESDVSALTEEFAARGAV
ncbi:MAG: MmgE/PrpD family protein [Steroidobacteraceae bacterium]|jgi:2-methylcitrate dehydratase PrpD|nr:MmgE/PrpD family protein [Steroidobacteraceae bacterium]